MALLISCFSSASSVPESRQLFFPVEKNAIKILPQRFEYRADDKGITFGDESFRSQDMSFAFVPPKPNADETVARFKWSGTVFQEGKLVLLDSTGKALWSRPVPREGVKKEATKSASGIRAESSIWTDRHFPTSLFTRLRLYPFFRFCVSREEERTHFLFCSRELFLRVEGQKLALRARAIQEDSQFEINGQEVSDHGVIFLQGLNDPINMRARFTSGATLDIESRQQAVEFRDIAKSENGKKITIKAYGAEPADPKLVRKTGEKTWVAEINPERPVLYMKGAAGIPMTQEFILGNALRPQSLTVAATAPLKLETYSSSYEVDLIIPEGWDIETEGKAALKNERETRVTWVMRDLETEKPNRRFVKLTNKDLNFYAAHEITRHKSWQWQALAGLPLEGEFSATKWWEGFHLGTRFEIDRQLMSLSSNNPPLGGVGISLLGTLDSAILKKDPQTGGLLGARQWTVRGFDNPAVSAGLFTQRPAFEFLQKWADGLQADAQVHLGFGSGTTRFKSAVELNSLLEHEWKSGLNLVYGLQIMSAQVDDDRESKNVLWISVRGGINGIF